MQTYPTKQGFTLIELLIVIAIIGVLASIVLVSLTNARVKAQEAKYVAYVSSVSRLVEAAVFAGDFEGVDYIHTCLGIPESGHCWGGSSYWETTNAATYQSRIDAALGSGVATATSPGSPANENYGMIIYHLTSSHFVRVYAYVGSGNTDMCDKFGWRSLSKTTSYCYRNLYY